MDRRTGTTKLYLPEYMGDNKVSHAKESVQVVVQNVNRNMGNCAAEIKKA